MFQMQWREYDLARSLTCSSWREGFGNGSAVNSDPNGHLG